MVKGVDVHANKKMDGSSVESEVELKSIIVKNVRQMLKNKSPYDCSVQVLQAVTEGATKLSGSEEVKESRLQRILDKFKYILGSELADGCNFWTMSLS